jgi:DNA gyrase/topoisomerase IV subunit A
MEREVGYGSRHAYAMLCDLVSQSTVQVRLVDGHGPFTTPDFAADGARYNECRLSPAGALAVKTERSGLPPLPIALINGTFYKGGGRPSFEPRQLIAGLAHLVSDDGIQDEELIDAVGPPAFPTGCDVSGDIDGLIAGHSTTLKLTAIVREVAEAGATVLDISNLPPGIRSSQVVDNIAARVNVDLGDELTAQAAIELRDVRDVSSPEEPRVRCVLAPGADPGVTAARLRDVWGVTIEIAARLPAPLPDLLRTWVRAHAADETADALAQLEAAF